MLIRKDPLLGALRFLVMAMLGICCFGAVMMLIAIPFAGIFHESILAHLAADGAGELGWQFIGVVMLTLLGLAILFAFPIYFFYLLMKITDTVRDGDPFIPENATRLSRMGWTAVAGWAWGIVITVPGVWIASIMQDAGEDAHFDAGFGGGGLVMILVLFVLARVFRKGTELRADLEGTV